MRVETHYCDACGAELGDDRHGLVVVFGHSPGGWGARRNLVNWSGEVCDHCYRRLGAVQAKLWGDKLAAIKAERPAPLPRAQVKRAGRFERWLGRWLLLGPRQ